MRRDRVTMDLFEGRRAPEPEVRLPVAAIRRDTFKQRVGTLVAEVLRDCEIDREEVAQRMGEVCGETVSTGMLNNYAHSDPQHAISLARAMALTIVTGDPRLASLMLDGTDYVVTHRRNIGAIEESYWRHQREEAEMQEKLARRKWRP